MEEEMRDNTPMLAGPGPGEPAPGTGAKVDTNRRIAVVAGVAFLIATLAQLVGVALVSPILGAPDYLTRIAAGESQVIVGALFLFIGALACTGIALALYPVLRKHNHGLAIGAVGFRTIEGVLHVLIAVCWLFLVSLSREAVKAGTPGSSAFAVPGAVLKAGPDWLAPLALLAFGLGALGYYWVFYRSRLIPRWLSAWGLVAIASVMVSAIMVMLGLVESFSTPQVVLAAPIGLQEMVLAVWLIAKGFNPRAVASAPAIATAPASATALAGAQTV
jgi:Domain of unknown function (DUF4386)